VCCAFRNRLADQSCLHRRFDPDYLMRPAREFLSLVSLMALSGCGYVHFGRLPMAAPSGDAALLRAYADVTTERKMLQQELALARKETDALRTALDRSSGAAGSSDLADRLSAATRELTALRASYAKLQQERTAMATAASNSEAANAQEENRRLRSELDRTRAENTGLAEQLKVAAADNSRAQAALAQLNTELLAQK
jgi:predicted nuclease with TOPRIM domain